MSDLVLGLIITIIMWTAIYVYVYKIKKYGNA